MSLPDQPFNPQGSGYDYLNAFIAGMSPDQTGHWSSRVPETGLLLKGAGHPTFPLTIEGEKRAGYSVLPDAGRYYSYPNINTPGEGDLLRSMTSPMSPFFLNSMQPFPAQQTQQNSQYSLLHALLQYILSVQRPMNTSMP